MAEDEERRLVAPLDVVEDDDQPVLCRGATHGLGHIVEDAEPVLRRLDVTAEHGVRLDSQRAEHLPPRPERRRTFGLTTPSPCDRGTARESDACELLGEPGLADTRLADTQNEATSPVAGGVEPLPQPLELAPSSDDAVTQNVHRILRRRTHATKHVPSLHILKAKGWSRLRPIERRPRWLPLRPSLQPCPRPSRKAHFVVVTVTSIPYATSSRASSRGS